MCGSDLHIWPSGAKSSVRTGTGQWSVQRQVLTPGAWVRSLRELRAQEREQLSPGASQVPREEQPARSGPKAKGGPHFQEKGVVGSVNSCREG